MAEITLNDAFGRAIVDTIVRYRLCRNLEIGAWDGLGSTQCFISGMRDLVGTHLYCIEFDKERYAQLCQTCKNHSFITCVNASSIGKNSIIPRTFDGVWLSPFNRLRPRYNRDTVQDWYMRDMAALNDIPNGFLNTCEESFDAVLIDGSEFLGYSEFCLLKNRTRCFFLDDVHNAYKCNQVYHELKDNWQKIYDFPDLRNGASIFMRP